MAPLTPEGAALRYLRTRELNRQAQQRHRRTDLKSVPSRIEEKAPWLNAAIRALMARRAVKQSNDANAKWKLANPEAARILARKLTRTWSKRHPEKIRERDARRYHTNPVRRANVIRQASFGVIKRRGIMYGVNDGTVTASSWLVQLEVFGHRCAYCGITGSKLHREHVTPLSAGGKHSIDNLVPACQKCNLTKSARGPLAIVNVPWKG